jgi:hypothetical protein
MKSSNRVGPLGRIAAAGLAYMLAGGIYDSIRRGEYSFFPWVLILFGVLVYAALTGHDVVRQHVRLPWSRRNRSNEGSDKAPP